MTRERLPKERPSITRHFSIPCPSAEDKKRRLKFYVVAGMHDDGRLAEIFIYTDRKTDEFTGLVAGVLDVVATAISIGLQHGAPLELFVGKLRSQRFGPSGFTGDGQFPSCTSMFDLMAQWLAATFPDGKYDNRSTRKAE